MDGKKKIKIAYNFTVTERKLLLDLDRHPFICFPCINLYDLSNALRRNCVRNFSIIIA